MKKFLLVLTVGLVSYNANAAIVCHGNTDSHAFKLTLERATHLATIEFLDSNGKTILQKDYSNVKEHWDGHLTGLITAEGLSIKYENHFGRLRHVQVTAALRSFRFFETVEISECQVGVDESYGL